MKATPQTWAYRICVWVFLWSFGGLVWARYSAVSEVVNTYASCTDNCVDLRLPAYDAANLGVCFALIGLAHLGIRRLRPLLAGAGILLLILYAIDLLVFLLLHHRLNLQDVLRYAGQFEMNLTVVWPQLASAHGMGLFLLLLLGCGALAFLVLKAPRSFRRSITLLAAAPLLVFARLVPQNSGQVASHLYEDVITYNAPSGIDTPYAPNFVAGLHENSVKKTTSCTRPKSPPRPVILLVMESLSLYQSHHLSGLHDYVPELDNLAQKYSYLQSYYANGFTTDGGLIALLTGNVPLPGPNRYASVDAYLGYEIAQQNAFNRLLEIGVPTTYFRSADQSFLATGDWLRTIGFQHVEGPEHPFYSDMPRGSFDEPGDRALYARYLQWFDEERSHGAFFSVIQTTTTHPPFIIPDSDESGEEAAFRYADAAMGAFVRELENRDFFADGILVITGDHRSMTSLRTGEEKAVGQDAPARVPAVVLGKEFEGRGSIPGKWQHTDFLPSLLYTMGLESCTNALVGRYLGEDRRAAKYILHAQGMERDHVMVVTDQATSPFKVKLDGANTGWVGTVPDPQAGLVIEAINRQRAQLPATARNFAPILLRARGFGEPS